jgi:hypothetical protein
MDEVQKPINSVCYTPSSEPYRLYILLLCLLVLGDLYGYCIINAYFVYFFVCVIADIFFISISVKVPSQYCGRSDYRSSVQKSPFYTFQRHEINKNPLSFKLVNDKEELVYQKYIILLIL